MATDILFRLQEQLKHSQNELKWVYHEELEMYNKHTQYVDDIDIINTKIETPINTKIETPINTKIETPINTKPETPINTKTETPINTKTDSRTKNKTKTKNTISPLEIILQESNTFSTYEKDVKEKLIEEVSQKEYNKVFGLKKTSEIMSGITNNRWNKSIALYISFLFDKTVKYNSADILYNSEKNNGIIIVS